MDNIQIIDIFKKEAVTKSRRYSERTISTYLSFIEKFLNGLDKDVSMATERDVRKFLYQYENCSDKTYNLAITSLNALFDILEHTFMVEDGYIKSNPMTNICPISKPKSKAKSGISITNYYKLLDVAKNSRDRAILIVLMNCGLRESELLNLTLDQYLNRDESNSITLTVTKGNKERKIYLNDKVIGAIEDYLKDRKEGCDYLFVSNGGKQMGMSSLYRTIKTLCKRANIDEETAKGISCHSFRHSMITNMISNGVPVGIVASMVGHSSTTTTMGYVDSNMLDVESAMKGVSF